MKSRLVAMPADHPFFSQNSLWVSLHFLGGFVSKCLLSFDGFNDEFGNIFAHITHCAFGSKSFPALINPYLM